MTQDVIDKLELQFGLVFHSEYRTALAEYPPDCDSEEFTGDANALITSNEGFRREFGWDFPWLDHLWWIGDDGSGGFYFISCDDRDCTVYYFDHEVPAKSFDDRELLKPRSLEAFISEARESEEDFKQYQAALLERIKNRKWWQFWVPKQPPGQTRS